MAGAISAAREGVNAVPPRWLNALEEGRKGRRHVERLADRLAAAERDWQSEATPRS